MAKNGAVATGRPGGRAPRTAACTPHFGLLWIRFRNMTSRQDNKQQLKGFLDPVRFHFQGGFSFLTMLR